MERISASASRVDATAADSDYVGTNSYLGAIALALANREVRQRLQLIIQAYDLLAAGCGTEVADSAVFAGGRVFSFGRFQLLPSQRLLSEGNRRVHIGSRAFDILTTLEERAGEVVGKDELIARVWPKVYVDDSNLKTQVSGDRRALGEARTGRSYIVAIPGRGYSFVAPVSHAGGSAPDGPHPKPTNRYIEIDDLARRHDTGNLQSLPDLIRGTRAMHVIEPGERT